MENQLISNNSIVGKDVKLGQNVRIYHFCNIFGNTEIDDDTLIASYTEIHDAIIGKRCRIGSHCSIPAGIKISNSVFVGTKVSFINDRLPLVFNKNYKLESTIVENEVSIGTGSTIMCGLKLGHGCIVGCGSVVTHNIPANEVWAGNPARFLRKKI